MVILLGFDAAVVVLSLKSLLAIDSMRGRDVTTRGGLGGGGPSFGKRTGPCLEKIYSISDS